MGIKVELVNIYKSFGPKVVLDGLNLTIEKNESFVLLGGSGMGKSVILKIVSGLMEPDSGSVLFDGVDIRSLKGRGGDREAINQKIGFLFQDMGLFDSLSLWENVAFHHLYKLHVKPDRARELAKEMLTQVGIGEQSIDLKPSEISGGMQKRVGIARVLIKRPGLILFDEPTSGLDPIMSNIINELTINCAKITNATAITITHDIHAAKIVGDKVAILHRGRILWFGSRADFASSDNEAVLQFVNGSSHGPLNVDNA